MLGAPMIPRRPSDMGTNVSQAGERRQWGRTSAPVDRGGNDRFRRRLWKNAFAEDGGPTSAVRLRQGLRADPGTQARIACSSGPTPMIAITRLILYARTWRLISVLTRFKVRVKKWVEPIQALMVPNGCSTVCRRTPMASGIRSSLAARSADLARPEWRSPSLAGAAFVASGGRACPLAESIWLRRPRPLAGRLCPGLIGSVRYWLRPALYDARSHRACSSCPECSQP